MSDLTDEEIIATRKLHGLNDDLLEDKIEVNEYVRTNNKGIKRIDRIDNNKTVNKYLYFTGIEDFEGKEYGIIKTTDIVKHSKELMDLIEVKDVIKYRIDNISTTLETKGYIEGIVDISDEEMLQRIKSDKNYHILEILTKEQYTANCYKVGGE